MVSLEIQRSAPVARNPSCCRVRACLAHPTGMSKKTLQRCSKVAYMTPGEHGSILTERYTVLSSTGNVGDFFAVQTLHTCHQPFRLPASYLVLRFASALAGKLCLHGPGHQFPHRGYLIHPIPRSRPVHVHRVRPSCNDLMKFHPPRRCQRGQGRDIVLYDC